MTAAAWHEEDDWILRVDTEVALEAEANLTAIAQKVILLKVVLIRHVVKDKLVPQSCLDGSAVAGEAPVARAEVRSEDIILNRL